MLKQTFIEEITNAPKNPIQFILFTGLSALVSLLSSGNLWAALVILALAAIWWWQDRLIKKEEVERITKIIDNLSRDLEESLKITLEVEKPVPSPGLILLLSPYSTKKDELKNEAILNSLIEQLVNSEPQEITPFEEIGIFSSNLVPQLEAVAYHCQFNKLKDVWLISTKTDETGKGSEITATILEKYLNIKYPNQLNIHNGQDWVISDRNYYALYQAINKIFDEADYKDEKIIADITGGTKMMSIALALACVPPKRKLQYMDSKRDWQGFPLEKGELKPILIDIDPIFRETSDLD